jgi:N-acetylmuramoyl-L-alanine amidase
MKTPSFALVLLALIHSLPSASAYELEDQAGYVPSDFKIAPRLESFKLLPTDPSERQRRFKSVLEALKIPEETPPPAEWFPKSEEATRPEFDANLPFLDPDSGLRRYLSIDDQGVSLYREFFSHILPRDYFEAGADFLKEVAGPNTGALLGRLAVIAKQVKNPGGGLPLRGLKVLIDPGHMGTPDWDEQTGKFVVIRGKKVSEGQLNLWTALLTARELEALGATVLLTRSEDGAVADAGPEAFDHTPYLHQYFYNSLDAWMAPLLSGPQSTMIDRVLSAPETKKAFTAVQKTQFFITGADLEARSRMIDQFDPDIVIDVHYDANRSDQLQNRDNTIEAFVPGGFRSSETGSRQVRAMMFNHLMETRRFSASVELADRIIGGMSASLGLKRLNAQEFVTAVKVKDGVYARNLYINRRNLKALMVYLECLHYDHTTEFPRLTRLDSTGAFRGRIFQYPSRLNEVVRGIREGLLSYFENLSEEQYLSN